MSTNSISIRVQNIIITYMYVTLSSVSLYKFCLSQKLIGARNTLYMGYSSPGRVKTYTYKKVK